MFKALVGLPGWEATDGNFKIISGKLRFVRQVRRIGDTLAYACLSETPRGFDKMIEASAARFAQAGAA